jgi:uncharacterized membrane protein
LRIKLNNDLVAIDLLSIILAISIAYVPIDSIRMILGIPFVLFFPGYTLVSALFPNKQGLSSIERIAFGFVLSIAVVALTGLALNYTPWGINIYPVLLCLIIFILAMSIIAMIRRNRLTDEDRFYISFRIDFSDWVNLGWSTKLLTALLILSILLVIGTIVYVITTPKAGERLTEFYILGPDGRAESYPRKIQLGDSASVILGIVNHEQETMTYRLAIKTDTVKTDYIDSIRLLNKEHWEQKVVITPSLLGDNQRVEIYLYKGESQQPYLTLWLWLDVVQ